MPGSCGVKETPWGFFWGVYSQCEIRIQSAGTYTSGDLDLFLLLKNSGSARFSMAWTLGDERKLRLWRRSKWEIDFHVVMEVPVVIKPGCVTGYDDMVGLFQDTVFSLGQAGQIPSPLLVFLHTRKRRLVLI